MNDAEIKTAKGLLSKLNIKGWGIAFLFLGLPAIDILKRLSHQRAEWDKQLAIAKKTCNSYADYDQRQACLHKALTTWAKNMIRAEQQELALLKQAYSKCPADKTKYKKKLWKQMQKKEKSVAYYKRLANILANPNTSISNAYEQAKES